MADCCVYAASPYRTRRAAYGAVGVVVRATRSLVAPASMVEALVARLSDDDRRNVRAMADGGMRPASIAALFGVALRTVERVLAPPVAMERITDQRVETIPAERPPAPVSANAVRPAPATVEVDLPVVEAKLPVAPPDPPPAPAAIAWPRGRRRRWYASPRTGAISGFNTCQYIAGEASADDSCKCGAATEYGSPWCPTHYALCWRVAPPREGRSS